MKNRTVTGRQCFVFMLHIACLIGLAASTATPAVAENTPPAATSAAAANSGLTNVKSKLDTVRVLPTAFGETKPLKIAVMPLQINYPKRRTDIPSYYREDDYHLSPRDLELLRKTLAEAFAKSWFRQQQWQLVADPATADLKLFADFKDFRLAAPLEEDINVHRTYTEESARFTLTGHIERADNPQHIVEFSDKRKLRQLGGPRGRMDRFNSVTFWRDMQRDLESVAGQLERSISSGKNGQKP